MGTVVIFLPKLVQDFVGQALEKGSTGCSFPLHTTSAQVMGAAGSPSKLVSALASLEASLAFSKEELLRALRAVVVFFCMIAQDPKRWKCKRLEVLKTRSKAGVVSLLPYFGDRSFRVIWPHQSETTRNKLSH
jgi:predicted TIM-barrel enzyme